jgi:hypothetical protein
MGEQVQRRIHWPLVLALWIGLSSCAALVWVLWPGSIAVDYAVFWRAVRQPDPYLLTAEPFAYPPTALLWFAPLGLVGFWPGFIAWTGVSVLAFGIAALRLYRSKPVALAALSPAVAVGLIPGQTSLLAAAGLIAAFAARSPWWRGALLGAVLTVKPQLVLFAPLFLAVDRQWRALAISLAVAAAIALGATLLFGIGIWADWLTAIPHFRAVVVDRGLSISAVAPASFAPALGIPGWPLMLLGLAAGGFIAFRSRGLPPERMVALIAVASLLSAPYALRYDLAAIAPLMAVVILGEIGIPALLACVAYSATFGPLSLIAGAYVALRRPPPLVRNRAAQ